MHAAEPAVPLFAHVRTWVFDLDNTLYPPAADLFGQMHPRMARFLMAELGVDEAEAGRLRDLYYHEHGTTLAGLIARHGTDPARYLAEVHDIDFSVLAPDPVLGDAIRALPGRRIVFTNGTRSYAGHVLDRLGFADAFAAVYGVEEAGHVSKPERAAFETVFALDGLDPARAAMVEDDVRNLAVPHGLGVRTVLLAHDPLPAPPPPHVDHVTADLAAFLRALVPAR